MYIKILAQFLCKELRSLFDPAPVNRAQIHDLLHIGLFYTQVLPYASHTLCVSPNIFTCP